MARTLMSCLLVALLAASQGCSIKRMAIGKIGDSLASGGSVYESDDDLELVGSALPFGLKLIESLLAEAPKHRGLLQAACQGFTTYSYAYVQMPGDETAERDLSAGQRSRLRAQRLYLRAHGYGIRGLEVSYPGIGERLLRDPAVATASVRKKGDVPLLYWTAAALGLAISAGKDDARLLARIPEVEALVNRARELDETWDRGGLHEFELTLAAAKPGKPDLARMEKHFKRALELSGGTRASLFVSYAENASLYRQDRREFQQILERALAIDPNAHQSQRLANLLAQRKAKRLLEQADELILGEKK